MSYYAESIKVNDDFCIKAENHQQLLNDLRANSKFKDFDLSNMKKAFNSAGFDVYQEDKDKDIEGIYFPLGKYSLELDVFMNAIAPYVEKNTAIYMKGEGDDVWRWCFVGGKFYESDVHLIISEDINVADLPYEKLVEANELYERHHLKNGILEIYKENHPGIELSKKDIEWIIDDMFLQMSNDSEYADMCGEFEQQFFESSLKDLQEKKSSAPKRDVVKNAQVADKVAGKDINKKI